MKKFLIATALTIATTTAFGAASLKVTPKTGGDVATTGPTPTTNMARAGTMRAQTIKTSSVSTPASVTTMESIATPVSTETTDARIALLKGIKGFSPNKIKDTTAAQQELNSINSQIEELQAQLDRAEAAQNTVLTTTNVDDKITASVTEKTYTRAEIDNLLNDIKRKLPTLDDRGNINVTDPNGVLISWSPYQYINTIQYPVVDAMHYNNSSLPNSEQSLEKIRNWARGQCQRLQNVGPREILVCGLQQAVYENGTWDFWVTVVYKGYAEYQDPETGTATGGIVYKKYLESVEYDTEEKFEAAACAGRSADYCYVRSFGGGGVGALTYLGYRATVVYVYNYKEEGE